MRRTPVVCLALVVMCLPLEAAARKTKKVGKPKAPAYYTRAEATKLAKELAVELKLPTDKRVRVLERLDKTLGHADYKTRLAKLNGVFAYSMGEGGFILKVKKGKGTAALRDGPDRVALRFSSTSLGAQVGGSREWGIGLVCGLSDLFHLAGVYKGKVRGATWIDAGASVTDLVRSDGDGADHVVLLVGAASGVSAGVASTKLTIALD